MLLPQSPDAAPGYIPSPLFHLINDIGKSEYTYGWYSASERKHDM
jgi:hypothetical protein